MRRPTRDSLPRSTSEHCDHAFARLCLDVPSVRARQAGAHAYRYLPVLLRVRTVQEIAATEGRRLLRVLFLRLGQVPPGSKAAGLLKLQYLMPASGAALAILRARNLRRRMRSGESKRGIRTDLGAARDLSQILGRRHHRRAEAFLRAHLCRSTLRRSAVLDHRLPRCRQLRDLRRGNG